jgi:tight adherence protein B
MLGELLTSLPLWIGLGLLMVLYTVATQRGGGKKAAARLARVTRRQTLATAQAKVASLRRVNPDQDSFVGSLRSTIKLRARLEIAGMAETTTPTKFLGIMAAIFLVVALIFIVVLGKSPLIGLLFGVLLGLGLPHIVVSRKIKQRQQKFLKLFPEAIELMVRGLRAGLPVAESFITVSKEMPSPLAETFATISQQAQLGVPMEKALTDSANKLGITEFNFFVTTIILQRETGGNLSEILNNLADMLRQRHMMKLKIIALSSEARASAYIVGALPFVVFLILQFVSPDYLAPLFEDARGNKALIGAGISMAMGAFVMKQMTQMEI